MRVIKSKRCPRKLAFEVLILIEDICYGDSQLSEVQIIFLNAEVRRYLCLSRLGNAICLALFNKVSSYFSDLETLTLQYLSSY
ncbi:hypothetical protein NIES23_09600 [Trichormus variabilis NIES-23]|uniref:Uncharacterized protein n=1 Tax=Trichormus variabilis NIES-23 TaxID=1973479 RepID=A0A1Z4KGR8_ANAVA|nr:hypothetical protein NIES23_09600 [Trichormus variabilis NIES-23]